MKKRGYCIMEKMIALVKERPERGLWMREVPVPECGKNDVKIKIRKTAICGTDLHIYNWDEWSQKTIHTPMTIGHEYVGEIVEVGENVTAYKVGDRVTGEGHIVCGKCRNCLAGKGPRSKGRRRKSRRRICSVSRYPADKCLSLRR